MSEPTDPAKTEQDLKNAKARMDTAAHAYHAQPTMANYNEWQATARAHTTAVEAHRDAKANEKLRASNAAAAAEREQRAEAEANRPKPLPTRVPGRMGPNWTTPTIQPPKDKV